VTVFVRPYRGGGYEYDIRIEWPSGETLRERRKSPLPSESGTRRWAEQRERHLYEQGPPTKLAPLFEDFAERWIRDHAKARQHKPAGIQHKEQVIRDHLSGFNGKRIDEIRTADIEALTAELAAPPKSLKAKTINNVLAVLSKMLRSAERWDVIRKAPPVELLRLERREMPFYPVDRYDALVAGARKAGPQALVLVLLAGDAGMRLGEIRGLSWEDIDFDRGVILIRRSMSRAIMGTTKGHAQRAVPMTTLLVAALEAIRKDRGPVFADARVRSLRRFVRAAEEAGGVPVTGKLHVLRHTYASHAAMAGESLYRIQQALGHRDSATTQRYAHMAPEALRPLAALVDKRRETAGRQLPEPAKPSSEMARDTGVEPVKRDPDKP
jgi:integrase